MHPLPFVTPSWIGRIIDLVSIRSVVALAVGALLLLPACGDDAPSGPDPEAFCETWTADTGQIPENADAWGAYAEAHEELAALAPGDIKPEVEKIAAAVRKVADGSQNFDDIYLEAGVSEASDTYRIWTSENCAEDGGYYTG